MVLVILLTLAQPFSLGRTAYEQGELALAERWLDRAIVADPRCARCWLYRALTEEEKAAGDGARFFERALALDGQSKETLRYYAESLIATGQLSRARGLLDRALAVDSAYADPHYLLAEIAERQGDRATAKREYTRHIALDPQSPAHHALADLALREGDLARAQREFAADLTTEPTCYEARINLAALELDAGQPGPAADEYRASLGFHPEDPRALLGLGRAYQQLHRHDLARQALRAACSLAPEDPQAKRLLAWSSAVIWGHAALPWGAMAGAGSLSLFWLRRRRNAVQP